MTTSILMFIGGIALFIYGITTLSDYLKKLSGNRFKSSIEKVINKPILAILIGPTITALTSSSSAIIIIVIGLVRAGLINSKQSVGLIMGANIGTTISAFIISLPISKYAYPIIAVGLILYFLKNKKIKNVGGIILSMGLLFLGLNTMGDGLNPLINTPETHNLFMLLSKDSFLGTITGFLFGTGFTSVIQSSSATTAIVQKLYSMNDPLNGIATLSLRGALPIVIGANLGTTITGLLASFGGNEESKRAALIHVIFNMIGALIFLPLINPYTNLISLIETLILPSYSMVTIAIAHLIQNLVTTLVLFFFMSQIVKLTELLIPYKNGKKEEITFDEKLIAQSPTIALESVKKAINHLSSIVLDYFYLTKNFSFTFNPKVEEEANHYEMVIDELNGKIHNYLLKIIRKGLRSNDTEDFSIYLDIIKDLERIGDHLSNIIEFFTIRYAENHSLSEAGREDISTIYETLEEMIKNITSSIYSDFKDLPIIVTSLEEKVDKLEESARIGYMNRLKSGEFDFYQTSNFVDILSDLERIGDHLNNIAEIIIDPFGKNVEITGLKKKRG
ncbi:Na/Pi cotransporter family protein [Haploplasma modicum]|uniref:Na/Pi cotransporter family protein n=1 Tax=Haploplasma modicum TaxID=2150 RepID=UPI00047A51CF|nr:Na/Pi cotransporter family protein [Haploplasma modicum]